MRYTLLSTAAALALIAAPACAQTTGTLPDALTAEEFMARAAMGDRFEIESAGIVQARSQTESTISYARHLVEDHERTADEMRAISRDVGVSPPVEVTLDPRHRQVLFESRYRLPGELLQGDVVPAAGVGLIKRERILMGCFLHLREKPVGVAPLRLLEFVEHRPMARVERHFDRG
jgi:Domain of unknown function (DUF4142)